MATEKTYRDQARIALLLDPNLRQEIEQWAVLEGRTISNLLRRVLSEAVDQRMAARAAGRRLPIQKQQLSA